MIRTVLRNAGIQPKQILASLRGWNRYVKDRRKYLELVNSGEWPVATEMPMLMEWNDVSGNLGAYFHQDQHVARWIYEAKPQRHVDVGSRLDGFVGSVSVFREIEVIDIRPQPAKVNNVTFHQLDLIEPLPSCWIECTDSLSCLHTIEHFGLGRYGDPIDVNGHIKGLEQLKRMVSPGGILYLSTPIGPQRLIFNAHRVTAVITLTDWFKEGWNIEKFAIIDDSNKLQDQIDWRAEESANHFGCKLGVGIIAARKST